MSFKDTMQHIFLGGFLFCANVCLLRQKLSLHRCIMSKESKLLAVFNVVRERFAEQPLQRIVNEEMPLASPFILRPISSFSYDLTLSKDSDVFVDVVWLDGTIGLEQSVRTLNLAQVVAWANTKVEIYEQSLAASSLALSGLDFYFTFAKHPNNQSFDICMVMDENDNLCLVSSLELHESIKNRIYDDWQQQSIKERIFTELQPPKLEIGRIYHCNLMQGKRPE